MVGEMWSEGVEISRKPDIVGWELFCVDGGWLALQDHSQTLNALRNSKSSC